MESSEQAQEAEDAVSAGKKLDFIINKSERLSGYLKELRDRYSNIRHDAENFYAITHPDHDAGASITAKRRVVAEHVILQHAVQTKTASESLCWACSELLGHCNRARS